MKRMYKYGKANAQEDELQSVQIRKLDDIGVRFSEECPGPEDLNTIYRNFAPYLYPFIIEFCILIVGEFNSGNTFSMLIRLPKSITKKTLKFELILIKPTNPHPGIFYMIWAHINHCPKKLSAAGHGHGDGNHNHMSSNHFPSLNSIPEDTETPNGHIGGHAPSESASDQCKHLFEHDDQYKNNIVVYADCHASSRGLFGGMVLMILTIVFIILLHVAVNEP